MNARVDRCTCRAPRDHPPVRCDACGRAFAHAFSVYRHGLYDHGLSPRAASLLSDRSRHQARGWAVPPIAPELAHLIGPATITAQPAAAEVPA